MHESVALCLLLTFPCRWTESIAQKVKRKKKVEDNSQKEIWRSVFDPQVTAFVTETGPVRP